MGGMDVKPKAARIEVYSACQLSCPACPTTTGQNRAVIGRGHLTLAHFRRFLALNPQIRHLELGNYGEVFLNRDLPGILHHARQSRVVVRIGAGVNLNNASEKALEALVSERVERMRCSIDGATNPHRSPIGPEKAALFGIKRLTRTTSKPNGGGPYENRV